MDRTIHEFTVDVGPEPYVRPLPTGHHFFHGDAGRRWVPRGDELLAAARRAVQEKHGLTLEPATDLWVMTLDRPMDTDAPAVAGIRMSLGDHQEGTSLKDRTLLVALNDMPDDAGGEFRLVERPGGPLASPLYPHRKGRGLMFQSRHFHGNAPLKYLTERVSLVQIVRVV